MSNRHSEANKRLAIGTVTYMIGNMTSKILQILILPIITATLSTSQYGYYDLLVTTISLVTPVVTFQMIEGMFRFMFDESEAIRKRTVSTVSAFLLCGFVVLAFGIAIVSYIVPALQYPVLIYLNYVSFIIYSFMQKLARCQQKNKQFAISGVLNTIVMLALQAATLLVFKMGVDGMLLANCISYFVASIYLACFTNTKKWLEFASIRWDTFIDLLKYSAPLIPNSVCWWLVASSDRYVITMFIGTAANGIYSIASKFSQLLTFMTSVFQLAWQESAIIERSSDERNEFYTNIFNIYMKLLMGGYLIVLPFIKIIMPVLLDSSYQMGYVYNPILLLGAVFSAFSQFYGSAYLVFKKTSGAFSTTIIAAVINLLIGIGLIKWIGLFAPALGTAVSFLVQWVIRSYQMKDYFKVKIQKSALISLSICMIIVTMVYYSHSTFMQVLALLFGTVVFIAYNRLFLAGILKKVIYRKA